jgi:hypothetical protein
MSDQGGEAGKTTIARHKKKVCQNEKIWLSDRDARLD